MGMPALDETTLSQAKKEAFAGRALEILNGAGLTLALSIGHRTRLLDIMGELPPSTSEQIASAAGLRERYVREWLGAMVTGRIVDYDPAAETYHLPPEHAASLTRSAGPENLASFAQMVPVLAQVEDKVVDCFSNGGGIPYSAYPRFPELMADISAPLFDAQLVDAVLPMAPDLLDALHEGVDVLEVGCGGGHALNLMARAFPKSRFIGYDLLDEHIAMGQTEAGTLGLTNVHFEKKDVATLNGGAQYDLVTAFDTVHDQAQPAALLKGIADVLRPGGTFLMSDVKASSHLNENLDHPLAPLIYTASCMHCMTVSLAYDGVGMGAMWGEEKAVEMLADAGMPVVTINQLPSDPINNFYVAMKS